MCSRHDYPRLAALALAVGMLGGCVSEPPQLPAMPEEAGLADTEAMLQEASEAGAAEAAPDLLRDARRRLVHARGILYEAAAASRQPNETERRRVRRLADEAWLDARLALARARRIEAESRLAELEAEWAALATEERP